MMPSLRFLAGLIAACTLLAGPPLAQAQEYPSRPVRMVIPFPAGTGLDVMGRVFAQKLGAEIGQPVVVENKAGAAGIIGAEFVAKAPPDGYTLMLGAAGVYSLNPVLFKKLPYDGVASFSPISFVYRQPLVVAISTKVPANTLAEFMALARAKPGVLNAGALSATHQLAVQAFATATSTSFVTINYKTGATAALIAGDIDLMVDSISVVAPQHKGGKLRALAVASEARMAIAPDVPTMSEVGYPGFELSTWATLVGPANLPKAIVDKLNAASVKVLGSPEMQALADAQGLNIRSSAPEYINQLVRSEYERWKKVAADAGLQPE